MLENTKAETTTMSYSPTPPAEIQLSHVREPGHSQSNSGSSSEPSQKDDKDIAVKAPAQDGNRTQEERSPEKLDKFQWCEPTSSSELDNHSTYGWLKDISSRVVKLENGPSKKEDRKTPEPSPDQKGGELITEPKVRDCNWEQFKNRYTMEDSTYAIEVLLLGNDLDTEMEDEQLQRLSDVEKEKYCDANPRKPARRLAAAKSHDKNRIERIRINSRAILQLLSQVTGENWADKPHTFLRPFKIPIYFHEKMKEKFSALEAKFGSLDEAGTSAVIQDTPMSTLQSSNASGTPETEAASIRMTAEDNKPSPKAGSQDTSLFDYNAYKEIKIYMDFVKDRLLPNHHKFDDLDHTDRPKVQFADLWSLFRPGELVFQRDDSPSPGVNNRHSPTGKKGSRHLWRVSWIQSHVIDWGVDNLDDKDASLRRNGLKDQEDLIIQAYYIDFNGASYHAVAADWTIKSFDGDKDVSKLELCPVRFEKDYKTIIKQLGERGERFRKLISESHLAIAHDGWTLTKTPWGSDIDSYNSEKHPPWRQMAEDRVKSEYIDSDVIIDFQEAYQVHSSWKPTFLEYGEQQFEPGSELDNFAIIQWSGPNRSKVIRKIKEVIIDYTDVESMEVDNLVKQDDFMISDEVRSIEKDPAKQRFTLEDVALLPERLCVYSLRQRRFVNADIANLKQLPAVPDPFNDLKIPINDKRLIKSIVQDHFDKKRVIRNIEGQGIEPLEQDFIRGKGKGLVILLHGAPGVGKTATAEAVAAAHYKPLFPITCGDLGVEPSTVEKTLSEIFRLANLWDCVLLLDEAEIFLSHREKKDDNLQRNALVSIFLRTLEYYPGILFLTTNRVGALDEALNSRVHVSLFFKHLDIDQTLALFKMNLERSTMIAKQRAANTGHPELIVRKDEIVEFAWKNFLDRPNNSDPWWNGRQIRNAFQIATSLAYVEQKDKGDGQEWYLGSEHFQQVLTFIQCYEEYRQNLFLSTDSELAARRQERPVPSRQEHHNARGGQAPSSHYTHQNPPFSTPSSSARGMSDRPRDSGFMRYNAYGNVTPTRYPREPSPSPNDHFYGGASSQQSIPRREYDQGYHQDHMHMGRPGGMQ